MKRDIGRKSRFFHTPAFNAPVMGSPSEYCQKLEWYVDWLQDGEKSLRICLAVLTEYRRVTDRRTDICDSIVRAMYSIARQNSYSCRYKTFTLRM